MVIERDMVSILQLESSNPYIPRLVYFEGRAHSLRNRLSIFAIATNETAIWSFDVTHCPGLASTAQPKNNQRLDCKVGGQMEFNQGKHSSSGVSGITLE